ncbi:MAG: hypothetical protein ACXWI5_00765 [Croceibacterium sp.]
MVRIIAAGSTLALAAAALAFAGPAAAKTVDSWEVNSTGKSCTMFSTFADDVTIGLIWTPNTGELGFIITLPHRKGWKAQSATTLDLSFDGKGPLTQWEDQHASVVAGSDSDAVIGSWGAAHSRDLARAVNASSHVTLSVGGRAIGTYDLTGSPAAYNALTRCGGEIATK